MVGLGVNEGERGERVRGDEARREGRKEKKSKERVGTKEGGSASCRETQE